MNSRTFLNEAEQCRKMAPAIANRNERRFLLSVARAFDELAGEQKNRSRQS